MSLFSERSFLSQIRVRDLGICYGVKEGEVEWENSTLIG